MRCLVLAALAALALSGSADAAQPSPPATLRVIVKDPSGAVIPHATVRVSGGDRPVPDASSDGQGVATVTDLAAGRYSVTAEFPGFETRTVQDVRVRAGDNRREITLPIEKVAQSVSVGRDAATAASDPRSDRFSNVLSKEQIDAIVKRTAGGGAEIVALLKTGSAYYAPSAAAVEMTESILKDKKKILPCAAYLEGEYGVNGLYVGVPCKLGAKGIEQVIEITLTAEERIALQKSAAAVQDLIDVLGI